MPSELSPALTATVHDTLSPLAAAAGVSARAEISYARRDRWTRVTMSPVGPPTILVPAPRARALDGLALQGLLAHELGHIALGHHQASSAPAPLRTDRRVAAVVGCPAFVAVLVVWAAALIHGWAVWLALLLSSLALAALSGPWLFLALRGPEHSALADELAADAYAVHLVGVTPVLSWLATLPSSPPTTSWPALLLRSLATHPPTDERVRNVLRLADSQPTIPRPRNPLR